MIYSTIIRPRQCRHVGNGRYGEGKGKGGEWEELTDGTMQILCTIYLKRACHIFSPFVSHSHDVADDVSLFCTPPHPKMFDVLRQYALHVLFCPPSPAARSTAQRHQCATCSHPSISRQQPHPCSVWLGQLGKECGGARWLGRESMERGMGNDIYRPTPDLTWTATLARPSNRTRTPMRIVLSLPTSPSPHALNTLQTPLPPLNNPTPKQTFLAKNYDENTRRPDRNQRDTFRTPTDMALLGPWARPHSPCRRSSVRYRRYRSVSGGAQATHRRRRHLYLGAP